MKNILRLLGLGFAALWLVFLTNSAQSSDVATNTDANNAKLVTANTSNYSEGQVAAKPYSSVNAKQRDENVDAAYKYVDALTKARNSLGIKA